VVHYGEERVGVLGREASNAYRQAVREAHDAGVIPITLAARSLADDGPWHLRLRVRIPSWSSSRRPAGCVTVRVLPREAAGLPPGTTTA
jgi:hypothetical protein